MFPPWFKHQASFRIVDALVLWECFFSGFLFLASWPSRLFGYASQRGTGILEAWFFTNCNFAASQYGANSSIPIELRFKFWATRNVVPDPIKGSSTVSPALVNSLMNHSGRLAGNAALWPLLPHSVATFRCHVQDIGRIGHFPAYPVCHFTAKPTVCLGFLTHTIGFS